VNLTLFLSCFLVPMYISCYCISKQFFTVWPDIRGLFSRLGWWICYLCLKLITPPWWELYDHPFSPASHLLIENHWSLIQICITPSLESTPWFIPSASPVMPRLTSSLTCQLISVIITTLIVRHSFTPGSKPTFSTYPSHLSTPSTLDCLHDHMTGLMMLLDLFLVLFVFNISVCPIWWTKLTTHQLFTAR